MEQSHACVDEKSIDEKLTTDLARPSVVSTNSEDLKELILAEVTGCMNGQTNFHCLRFIPTDWAHVQGQSGAFVEGDFGLETKEIASGGEWDWTHFENASCRSCSRCQASLLAAASVARERADLDQPHPEPRPIIMSG
jgi:hypothetical protein